MLVTAPYTIGTGDRRADGLAEAHVDAVLEHLNFVSDMDFTAFLKHKLVEWYASAPKNDPVTTVVLLQERRPTTRPPGRRGGGGGTGGL